MNLLNYSHNAYMFINTHLTRLITLRNMTQFTQNTVEFVNTTWNARGSCVLLFMYSCRLLLTSESEVLERLLSDDFEADQSDIQCFQLRELN